MLTDEPRWSPRVSSRRCERDRLVPDYVLRWARLRATTHVAGDARRAADRVPPARAALALSRPVQPSTHVAGARGAAWGRSGKRRVLIDSPGPSIPTAAWHPEIFRSMYAPARSCASRSLPLIFENSRPGAGRRPRRKTDAARVHAPLRRLPHRGQRLSHARAAPAANTSRRHVDPVTHVVSKAGSRRRGDGRAEVHGSRRRRASSSSSADR